MDLTALDNCRLHFTGTPDIDLAKEHQALGSAMKPSGLWWSCGFHWAEWCLSEEFHRENLRHVYRLEIDEDRLLKIGSVKQLKKFDGRYGCGRHGPNPRNYDVDWITVGRRYDAIEINPYQWEMRHSDAFWYYSWDVASGCLWRERCLESVEYLGEVSLDELRAHVSEKVEA